MRSYSMSSSKHLIATIANFLCQEIEGFPARKRMTWKMWMSRSRSNSCDSRSLALIRAAACGMSGTCVPLHSVGIERDAEVITPFLNFRKGLVGHSDTLVEIPLRRSLGSLAGNQDLVYARTPLVCFQPANHLPHATREPFRRQKSGDIEEAKEMTNVLFAIEVLIH